MRVGQNRRRDKNEPDVVSAFNQCGWLVFRVSAPGLPDLLCTRRGLWKPVECKMPGERLTTAQLETFLLAPFDIVEGPEDVVKLPWVN